MELPGEILKSKFHECLVLGIPGQSGGIWSYVELLELFEAIWELSEVI